MCTYCIYQVEDAIASVTVGGPLRRPWPLSAGPSSLRHYSSHTRWRCSWSLHSKQYPVESGKDVRWKRRCWCADMCWDQVDVVNYCTSKNFNQWGKFTSSEDTTPLKISKESAPLHLSWDSCSPDEHDIFATRWTPKTTNYPLMSDQWFAAVELLNNNPKCFPVKTNNHGVKVTFPQNA